MERKEATLSPKSTQQLIALATQCQECLLNTRSDGCMRNFELMESQFLFLQHFQLVSIQNDIDSQLMPLHQVARIRLQSFFDPTFIDAVKNSLENYCYNYSEMQQVVESAVSLAQSGCIKVRSLIQI